MAGGGNDYEPEKTEAMTILLDFDGTVVEHQYPSIGRTNPGWVEVVNKLQQSGHRVLLNTMRCEFNDGSLVRALQYISRPHRFETVLIDDSIAIGEITLEPIIPTKRKQHPAYWDWEFFKANDCVIIDDQSQGVPLKRAAMTYGWMVDWDEIDRQLEANGLYEQTPTNGKNTN